MLILLQQKTGRPVRIPLHDKALKLLNEKPVFGKLFSIPVNQVYNRQVKDIAKIFDFKKKLSSHTARHTFACVGLDLGISLKSISDMLGHNSVRTTEIYARMNDTLRKSEAAKFDLM
jgi:integrase